MDAGLASTARPGGSDRVIAREELRRVIVGAAAVLLFGAVLVATYLGMAANPGASASYDIYAMFNRVDGLAIGDSVQMAGVPVGEVDSMALGPSYRARVGFRIADPVKIPEDTSVSIQTDGLFGRKYIELEPGGSETLLGDGGVITFTQDSLIVGELLDLIIAEGRAQRALPGPDGTDATQPH